MADLEFEFHDSPPKLGLSICDYCEETIRGAYVYIKLNRKQQICIGECWNNYVIGVAMMNEEVDKFETRKVN